MYLGPEGRGRLAGEMRWRVAALIALSGMAAVPAASGAQPGAHAATLSVSVKPRTGSARTHFAVSFRAARTTGPKAHNTYRITAGVQAQGRCRSGVAVDAPPTAAGSIVRVVLSPGQSAGWCAGTFRGQVWDVISVPCPVGKACPTFVPAPRMVGKFTFRVVRG
jgi:hypothetical protein